MSIIKYLHGEGEIIVPALTWVSDIASVIQNDCKPVFVDINMKNLSMNTDSIIKSITKKTKAVAVTVSESNGTVRLFHKGEVLLRVEPFRRAMKWKDFEYEPPLNEE